MSCHYHLYLDITDAGSLKLNAPDLEPWDLAESCALDVADRGGITLEETGAIMNLTRERVRQIEVRGLLTARMAGAAVLETEADPGEMDAATAWERRVANVEHADLFLSTIGDGERSTSQIARAVGWERFGKVREQLLRMEQAGLVESRRVGADRTYYRYWRRAVAA